ncbi:tetratricopeptide repeat protein [Aquabacterium sp. OR-4]|uniref:tetratricopeptide repeat protein n=1 Tax=Aquabacterium sp. OR-4 TaxID=2978127 RepID=UPI0021B4A651|nr:tetratricopeptide repeat protein [Aquabacterium sp. OR-4]MDT7833643.1 tetratricopeptide repeat protein [Aquabacterium sp. OR-4]
MNTRLPRTTSPWLLSLLPSLLSGLLLAAAADSFAADTPAVAPVHASPADKLAVARTLIADGRWAAAIAELTRVDERASADWHNLMGYSHRKARQPDHAAAERHYNEALRIDPRHRGALEYSGELYLMTGRLPLAEARLATLDQLCTQPCPEQAELRQAIAAHKANGNRPVRAP